MRDNNKYEVGVTPDDNNDMRLPNSVQPEPVMGATDSNFGQAGSLDVVDTIVVGKTHIGEDYVPVPRKTASVTGPMGVVETTYDHSNLSAKYKYPNVSQDIPPAGKPVVQYNDHS